MDDVIAESPHRSRCIVVVTVRISETRQIKPHLSHALAILRRGQQTIDQRPIGAVILISKKRLYFLRRRWHTAQIQAETPDERARVRLSLRHSLLPLQSLPDPDIKRVSHPAHITHRRQGRTNRRLKGPVPTPLSPFVDPLP